LQIAEYKLSLFSQLSAEGKNILELGVGTGPNLKYYASADGVKVIGVDPNMYMEEYSRAAATSTGLPPSNFTFRRGVWKYVSCGRRLGVFAMVFCQHENCFMPAST
jgi:cyclopropane fatty-acyl-phospholipid synthase-like methyltransferase